MLVVQDRSALLFQWLTKCVLSVCFLACCAYIHRLVSAKVPDPFIDEYFHLRQTAVYCAGRWSSWDSKITTPPGLYVLGVAYGRALEYITGLRNLCADYNVLRSLNLIGGVVVLPIITRSIGLGNRFWSINIVSQPLLFSYYFLFYTDVWSTVLVVASLLVVVRRPFGVTASCWISAIVGFLSLWFRQTNIVWLAFVLLVFLDTRFTPRTTNNLIKVLMESPKVAIANWKALIPFGANFAAFIIFLKINGGITFGDKENHQVNAHVVQVFYCFAFISAFTWPIWLDGHKIHKYVKFVGGGVVNIVLTILSIFTIKFIIDKFTIVHPFLLADNRHYTFYIFKRIISNKYSPIVTIPLYHFSTWNIVDCLHSSRRSVLVILLYFVAVIITLVPSPLFEPRYYIVPLVMFRLLTQPVNNLRHLLEFAWLNAINAVTQYVFFNYEFRWDSAPGVIQRIIW